MVLEKEEVYFSDSSIENTRFEYDEKEINKEFGIENNNDVKDDLKISVGNRKKKT